MMRSCVRLVCFASVLALVSATSISAEVTLPIRMRAFAVNMSNNLTGANGILQITLDRWSTEEERATLLKTVPKGQDDLVRALQKAPVKGRINIPGWQGPDPQNYRLGWDLRYAWHESLPDGGDRIVIATDRQMSSGRSPITPGLRTTLSSSFRFTSRTGRVRARWCRLRRLLSIRKRTR